VHLIWLSLNFLNNLYFLDMTEAGNCYCEDNSNSIYVASSLQLHLEHCLLCRFYNRIEHYLLDYAQLFWYSKP